MGDVGDPPHHSRGWLIPGLAIPLRLWANGSFSLRGANWRIRSRSLPAIHRQKTARGWTRIRSDGDAQGHMATTLHIDDRGPSVKALVMKPKP